MTGIGGLGSLFYMPDKISPAQPSKPDKPASKLDVSLVFFYKSLISHPLFDMVYDRLAK
jgi:hypothetical protein